MSKTAECKFWIAINSDGEFVISKEDATSAITDIDDEFSNEAVRTFEVNLNLPLPQLVLVTGAVSETEAPGTLQNVTLTVTSAD